MAPAASMRPCARTAASLGLLAALGYPSICHPATQCLEHSQLNSTHHWFLFLDLLIAPSFAFCAQPGVEFWGVGVGIRGGWIGRLAPILTRFWLIRLSVLGGSDGCRLRCRRQKLPKWVLRPVLRWRRPGAPPSPPRARAAPAPPPRTTCCCGSIIFVFKKSTHIT